MITLNNVCAVIPSNIDEDLEYRIECRAEHIKEEIMHMSVSDLLDTFRIGDRLTLDEMLDIFAYTLATKEITQ